MDELDAESLGWVLEHGGPEQREAARIVGAWNDEHPVGQPEIL